MEVLGVDDCAGCRLCHDVEVYDDEVVNKPLQLKQGRPLKPLKDHEARKPNIFERLCAQR